MDHSCQYFLYVFCYTTQSFFQSIALLSLSAALLLTCHIIATFFSLLIFISYQRLCKIVWFLSFHSLSHIFLSLESRNSFFSADSGIFVTANAPNHIIRSNFFYTAYQLYARLSVVCALICRYRPYL